MTSYLGFVQSGTQENYPRLANGAPSSRPNSIFSTGTASLPAFSVACLTCFRFRSQGERRTSDRARQGVRRAAAHRPRRTQHGRDARRLGPQVAAGLLPDARSASQGRHARRRCVSLIISSSPRLRRIAPRPRTFPERCGEAELNHRARPQAPKSSFMPLSSSRSRSTTASCSSRRSSRSSAASRPTRSSARTCPTRSSASSGKIWCVIYLLLTTVEIWLTFGSLSLTPRPPTLAQVSSAPPTARATTSRTRTSARRELVSIVSNRIASHIEVDGCYDLQRTLGRSRRSTRCRTTSRTPELSVRPLLIFPLCI